MPKLTAYEQISLDGYFVDAHGDMSWAKQDPKDAEWNAYVSGNASSGGALVFGRVTYQMMASFWPTPMAMQAMPVVAKQMSALPKFVFSRTLKSADWNNTTLLRGDPATEMRRLKAGSGPDMTILGSGNLTGQLAQAGLIDEYTLVVNPLVLGAGRTVFQGVTGRPRFKLTATRTFGNGNIVLTCVPAA